MDFEYVIRNRTDGANPFKIWEFLPKCDPQALAYALRRMPYRHFLKSAYWFAVSHVAKSRAGMRCQVCNGTESISVHHRTYDTHGAEHLNMIDLIVLDGNCHGLFHGHKEVEPPRCRNRKKEDQNKGVPRGLVMPHSAEDIQIPERDPIVLTKELVDNCRANGSFTNATLNALGVTKASMTSGWAIRLEGQSLSRDQYRKAVEGKFVYRTRLNH